uniref:NADH-ubiquinone oxidoreductase chain 3 n=1 Tax=Ruditapes philippinarum TaxID=129788 RepID=Q8WF38_RUDPH|nr:NADH dehydrogenase subunit 3 [Ruditapes philippinarum]AAP74591.1 NADH dehydrogenase subunit 3 [Ruditapes philippinarum]AAP74598.1 NADH dehydrogenase subunit 3 [Ruditapes philippinarum]AAP74605.1 NADH dehydrogenase subunit 3 [Ruditapes philippinarum]AAP74612.1 NADH dehydrogenase subunit 3 [Ruditapes philippinarum]
MWLFEKNFNSLNPHFSIMMVVMMVIIMGSVFLSLSVVVSQKWRFEKDKLTSFECGFDPMSSSRMPFSLRFFLLALLFLVFDLEMILLFPYVFSVSITSIKMKVISKLWGFIFLVILVGGLVHELNEGTLDWNKE